MGPGASQIVPFNDTPNSVPDGTPIPFTFELRDSAATVALLSRTLVIDRTTPLELAVEPRSEPAAPGSLLTYDLTYGNDAGVASGEAVLSFPVPAGTSTSPRRTAISTAS